MATFSPFAASAAALLEQLPAQIMRLEQMTEAAHRSLTRHRLATEVDAIKMPHRLRIVERLFHCRVGQIEPVLQEIDAQHPLDPDRRAAGWCSGSRIRNSSSGKKQDGFPAGAICVCPNRSKGRRWSRSRGNLVWRASQSSSQDRRESSSGTRLTGAGRLMGLKLWAYLCLP